MFKLILIGALVYVFYRLTFSQKKITGNRMKQVDKKEEKNEEGDYIDYEEVD